ncbi:GNAT family N-acetyltransferase [Halopelagius longus]|uniref:Acetyltransferase (GNAT) domain-containing protein n=1 Tax=Halopelagius longus TaxID=1236180 RepID=A0A1H0Y125_9EURY|nr:GNAT family N-acetyltransferase [Halopelagius longus]RDI72214.1 GNAT family N-acetyltransferase [Halopelagius longus]SDQ08800.1 Acetyltransferase (GNAT) domain-containing protein [Halopelagius longus]
MTRSRKRSKQSDGEDAYAVRPYRPGDREGFLSLYDTVFGATSEEWFRWKYADNPYAGRIPMYVAESEGDIVGASPFFALRVRVGGDSALALQPADAMVHPDHRRRGLLTRMTEAAIDDYEEGDPAMFFNFPNPTAKGAFTKLGWVEVGDVTTHYRVQNPANLTQTESAFNRLTAPGTALARAYFAVRDRLVPAETGRVTVERREEVPAAELAALYAADPPEEIHVVRDERFYQWRYENPKWEYTSYLARRDGDPVAGLVVGTRTSDGTRVTKLVDAVPCAAGREATALSRLVHRAIDDHRDADLIGAWDGTLPDDVLDRFGFRADDHFPLSRVSTRTAVVARALEGDDTDVLRGVELDARTNWRLMFAGKDTC